MELRPGRIPGQFPFPLHVDRLVDFFLACVCPEIESFSGRIFVLLAFVRKNGISPDEVYVIFAYSDKSYTFALDMTMTYKLYAIL